MTSSGSSSASARAAPPRAVALALVLAAGCAGARARPPPATPPRVALFPVENLSGGPAPVRELLAALEGALSDRGLEVVAGEPLQRFLSRHRIRHTGGLDRAAARAAREELGVDGVILATLEAHRSGPPPRLALTARLVSAGEEPVIEWIDGYGRAGDDAPGLLALGVVERPEALQREAVARLAGSLAAFLSGEGAAAPDCGRGRRYRPALAYRSSGLDPRRAAQVAVVPFLNRSSRRGAGELVQLAFARQLAASGRFRPLEPGVVREALLANRIVMEGGLSLEAARLLVGALDADLVLSGEVLDYDDTAVPRVNFAATVLDRGSGEVVWQSISHNAGDDGVLFFGLGQVSTAHGLTCRMAGNAVDGMLGNAPAKVSDAAQRR